MCTFRFSHPNIIQLVGYCASPPALIYPFMEQHSLHYAPYEHKVHVCTCTHGFCCIRVCMSLSSEHRSHCSGRKESPFYVMQLHSSSPPYVHQDINRVWNKCCLECQIFFIFISSHSPNILLDADRKGVVADFGFVTALPVTIGSTCVVTAAGALSLAWSRGYLAPEVADGKHGVSSDVYSYGVVGR